MQFSEQKQFKLGLAQNILSRILWGSVSIYIGLMPVKNFLLVFSHRVTWAFVFSLFLVIFFDRTKQLYGELINPKKLAYNFLIGFTITSNWFVVIYCIEHNQLLKASMGFYIAPIFAVALGVIFLKEKINIFIMISLLSCLTGVYFISHASLMFPWPVAWVAITSALYALGRKRYPLDPFVTSTLESGMAMIIMLLYISVIGVLNQDFVRASLHSLGIFIGLGVLSTIPMMFYASSLKKLPLALIGYLQYITPTIMFLVSIFLFGEKINVYTLVGLLFIWMAIAIYLSSPTLLTLFNLNNMANEHANN